MNNPTSKFSEVQSDAFEELKKSSGWAVIAELAGDIVKQECDLEDVDEKLPESEYKTECLARKKAKRMFTQIFEDINFIDKRIKQKKKDFS